MKRSHWLALFAGVLLGSGLTWGFIRSVERFFRGKPVPVALRASRSLTAYVPPGDLAFGKDVGGLAAGTQGLLYSKGSIRTIRVEATWIEPQLTSVDILPEGTQVIANCEDPTPPAQSSH
ncbi:hypothetical protein ACQKGO_11870 [Corallococcus interemptor]|uniref:hypothetical protein n=1 Tax=Corallococcus interemptor TaxID=2316720 RepID=UPI003CFFAB90